MVFVLGPEHAVRDRAVLDAGGRPGTTRAVLVDYGKDVGFAFALGCRAAGDRLGLDDTSCLILFYGWSGVRQAKPPEMLFTNSYSCRLKSNCQSLRKCGIGPVSETQTYQAQATNCGTVGLMTSRRPRILNSKIWFGLGVLAFCLGISVYVCRRDRVIGAREGTGVGIVTDRQTIRFGTRIIYTFSVNGRWFTGSNSSSMNDDLWPGAQVSVYYDSRNPNENALIDFAALSQSPYRAVSTWWDAESRGWLIAGGFFLLLAVIGTFTGETFVRFQGVLRRAEDPKGFWWDVALYYFFGAIFIALYLLN